MHRDTAETIAETNRSSRQPPNAIYFERNGASHPFREGRFHGKNRRLAPNRSLCWGQSRRHWAIASDHHSSDSMRGLLVASPSGHQRLNS